VSRVALSGLPFSDTDKEFLLELLKKWSRIFFVDVLGFAIMGNHFHLVVRMYPANDIEESEVVERYRLLKGEDRAEDKLSEAEIEAWKTKLCSLSWYVKEIKQGFSRYFNRKYNRRGFLWGERFKSVIVEEGEALVNLLAYVDLNAVRAGIVKRPEDYRWCGLGYFVQSGNKEGFLNTDFGMDEWGVEGKDEVLRRYREYVYEVGGIEKDGSRAHIPEDIVEKERRRGYKLTRYEVFRLKCRYFTDGCILGSKRFVEEMGERFQSILAIKGKRKGFSFMPGDCNVCSFRRLRVEVMG